MGLFSGIKDKVLRYVEVNIKLLKVNFIGHAATLMGSFMFGVICLVIACCILFFLGMGAVQLFIDSGMSEAGAYFLAMGVYCLVLFLVLLLRKPISRFFTNSFINTLTEDQDNTDETKQS